MPNGHVPGSLQHHLETDVDFADYVRNEIATRAAVPNLLSMLLTSRTVYNEVCEVAKGSLILDYHALPTALVRISWARLPDSACNMIGTIKLRVEQASLRVDDMVGVLDAVSFDICGWAGQGNVGLRSGQRLRQLIAAASVSKLVITVSGVIWRASMERVILESDWFLPRHDALEITRSLPFQSSVTRELLQAVRQGELMELDIEMSNFEKDQYNLVSDVEEGIFESREQYSTDLKIVTRWEQDGADWKGRCVVTRSNEEG